MIASVHQGRACYFKESSWKSFYYLLNFMAGPTSPLPVSVQYRFQHALLLIYPSICPLEKYTLNIHIMRHCAHCRRNEEQ